MDNKELLERHIKGLEHLREDLLMRAEIGADGRRVVSVGNGAWCALSDAIEFLAAAQSQEKAE